MTVTEEISKKHIENWSQGLCPKCLKVLPMRIYRKGNIVFLEKTCPEHGRFEDVYWGDAEMYRTWQDYDQAKYIGGGIENPRTQISIGCPQDCGICPQHRTATVLSIIDVTNRCNMACPICFAYAGAIGYVYEPSFKQIKEMLKNLRSNSPRAPNAIQFSGGEPTLRNDLPKIIMEAKKVGFTHIEVNTNGLRLAEDLEYFKKIRKAGMDTLYLQFDGLRSEIYKIFRAWPNMVEVKKKVLENARSIGLYSIVLVVTLAKGVNDKDVGDIIDFVVENKDVIRCINIQPISFAGRASKSKIQEMRITTPDVIKLIEEHTGGEITRRDFRPVNWPVPVSRAMELVKGRMYPDFVMNPFCGAATFIMVEDGKLTPITKIVDVDKFADIFWNVYYQTKSGSKAKAKLTLLKLLPLIKSSIIRKLINGVIKRGSYKALGDFMRSIIMIGIMHFMDTSNMDLNRTKRCGIHYAVPDGRIISFCTYNSIHRPMVEKKFAIKPKEWRSKHKGARLNEPV